MEDVPHVEAAMADIIDDVEPEPVRARVGEFVEGVSLTPSVLTVTSARAIDGTVDARTAARRGAGVQLSYEGLRKTRSLIREDPWAGADDPTGHHLDLLATEVLTSKGFSQIANTGVRAEAVEILRRFSRNRTREGRPDPGEFESSLEVDVIRFAIQTGADLVTGTVPATLRTYADELARELATEPLPRPDEALQGVEEEITRLTNQLPSGESSA